MVLVKEILLMTFYRSVYYFMWFNALWLTIFSETFSWNMISFLCAFSLIIFHALWRQTKRKAFISLNESWSYWSRKKKFHFLVTQLFLHFNNFLLKTIHRDIFEFNIILIFLYLPTLCHISILNWIFFFHSGAVIFF